MGALLLIAGSVFTTGNIVKSVIQAVSSVSDILSIISIIKDRVDDNQGMKKVIDKAINKAITKAGRTNYLDIRPSNSELTEFVIKKTYDNDYTPSTNWFRDKEFDVFYNTLINDKDYWGILQELIQNNRGQILNEKTDAIIDTLQEICNRLDKQDEQHSFQNEQLRNIDKKLDIITKKIDEPKYQDWLIPYETLSFSKNEENTLFRDEGTIISIEKNLNNNHVCLIKACEGRGKTFLCRIVATDYHKKDFEVNFVDFKNNTDYYKIVNKLINWKKEKQKDYLIVFENIHACQYLKQLIDSIIDNKNSNLYFLLNARPTEIEYEKYLSKIDAENTIKFNPGIRYSANVAKKLCRKDRLIDYKELCDFISQKIYTNQKGNGANLRLLKIYLDIWNKEYSIYSNISQIKEEEVLLEFQSKYDIRNIKEKDKNTLLYLSSISQFDTPLPKSLLTVDAIDFLSDDNRLLDGIVIKQDGKFYLPHSVDALYLCKAICYYQEDDYEREYKEKTNDFVKTFISSILANKNPRKFENDFRLLVSGIMERKVEIQDSTNSTGTEVVELEFKDLIKELTQWENQGSCVNAKNIIEKIDPGFIFITINQLYCSENNDNKNYYINNKAWFKKIVLESEPSVLMLLNLTFSSHYDYHEIVSDILTTPKEVRDFVSKLKDFNVSYANRRRQEGKRVMKVQHKNARFWGKLRALEDKFIAEGRMKESEKITHPAQTPVTYDYYFDSKTRKGVCVNKDFVKSLNHSIYPNALHINLEKMCNGFYFKTLNWKMMVKLTKAIKKAYDSHRDERLCSVLITKITDKIIENHTDSFQHATVNQLDEFYKCVSIDKASYDKLLSNEYVVEDAKRRLNQFEQTMSEYYYFRHFGKQEWCKGVK